MIREDVLYLFYPLPLLIASEWLAIREALPYWVGANVFLNRDKTQDCKQKHEWPASQSASAILENCGIDFSYRRGQVRFCHIEYELRRQAAEIIFGVDTPKRHEVREEVAKILFDLGVTVDPYELGYRKGKVKR